MKKLVVLNLSVVAILGFLLFNGLFLSVILNMTLWPVHVLTALTVCGVLLVILNRDRDAKWISNHMTRFGMIGTLIGMIAGLSGLQFNGSDVASMATELVHHTAFAFLSTLAGVVGNIWINFNMHLKATDNET